MAGTIDFTPALRDSLRETYEKAKTDGEPRFVWHGHEFATDYARHLLDYLDDRFRAVESLSNMEIEGDPH